MMAKQHLVVFAKAPRLGNVKTRLAADIGPVAASGFYRRTLNDVLRRLASDRRWTCHLAVTPDRAVDGHRFWPRPFNAIGQGPGDLGERMNRVFQDLPPGPVVLVGTDVPGIRAAHFTDAFRALGNNDAVFGPARDGGYWLVGARRRPVVPDLFGGITWSTPRTLKDTLTKLNGKKVALLDPLDDIDDGAAYEKLITGAL